MRTLVTYSDLGAVLKNDAGGVGLFRSEFLYLENSTYPTEEQQFAAYKQVVESMAGKKVIIRTLDIGADKQVDYFNLAKEENPALGYRAIRICLTRPEIFKTQLRALYRASVYGNLSIMFPMIISVKEVRKDQRDHRRSEGRVERRRTSIQGRRRTWYYDRDSGISYDEPRTCKKKLISSVLEQMI